MPLIDVKDVMAKYPNPQSTEEACANGPYPEGSYCILGGLLHYMLDCHPALLPDALLDNPDFFPEDYLATELLRCANPDLSDNDAWHRAIDILEANDSSEMCRAQRLLADALTTVSAPGLHDEESEVAF